MFDIAQSNISTQPAQAFSVSEINTIVADLLNSGLPGAIWVEGEISNLSVATSGHRYFSLKDNHSTISCALFRNSANRISRDILQSLKNGDKILVKAAISVYKPRGSYQLIVNDIEPAGFGALAKAFIELKNKLEQAGLFANERKRPTPTWPKGIGVVTSATGAALRDVLTTLQRRAPFIPVTVYPTLVQGATAPTDIINALTKAGKDNDIDVILLVRGGGSLEDLMAFNDENVAMAVANCPHPIISGVGHETDFSIVDFISDYRAATPTAAAEVASPNKSDLQQHLSKRHQRLQSAIGQDVTQKRQQLRVLQQRLNVQHPTHQLQQQSQRIDEIDKRLKQLTFQQFSDKKQQLQQYQRHLNANSPRQQLLRSRQHLQQLQQQLQQSIIQQQANEQQRLRQQAQRLGHIPTLFERHRQQLKGLQARLTLLSPLGVLDRGYALAFDENKQLLRSIEQTQHGQKITLRLADGTINTVVAD